MVLQFFLPPDTFTAFLTAFVPQGPTNAYMPGQRKELLAILLLHKELIPKQRGKTDQKPNPIQPATGLHTTKAHAQKGNSEGQKKSMIALLKE